MSWEVETVAKTNWQGTTSGRGRLELAAFAEETHCRLQSIRRGLGRVGQGQSAAPAVNVTINARDADSFRQSRTQVAERLSTSEKIHDIQRQMLEAAARRPADRDALAQRKV